MKKENMPKIEKKVIGWMEEHLFIVLFVGVTLLSAYIRFLFRSYISNDMKSFLLPWYLEIKNAGGLMGGWISR